MPCIVPDAPLQDPHPGGFIIPGTHPNNYHGNCIYNLQQAYAFCNSRLFNKLCTEPPTCPTYGVYGEDAIPSLFAPPELASTLSPSTFAADTEAMTKTLASLRLKVDA